jgi:hypothetical protein
MNRLPIAGDALATTIAAIGLPGDNGYASDDIVAALEASDVEPAIPHEVINVDGRLALPTSPGGPHWQVSSRRELSDNGGASCRRGRRSGGHKWSGSLAG